MAQRSPLLAATLAALALPITLPMAISAHAESWPAPIQALVDEGLQIHGEFDAPEGLQGYAASHQGREMTLFLTADGEHAIVGTLVDAEGNDLSEAPLETLVRAPLDAQLWQDLEQSHWIQDGDPAAPRVLYTFTDPNCPYCVRFWEMARPWVEAGEVQLRHVMVGILQPNSPAKAAALLGADDPAAALHNHSEGESIAPSAQPREIEDQVYRNNQLFDALALLATPTTFYRDGTRVEVLQGIPDSQRLHEAMGGEQP